MGKNPLWRTNFWDDVKEEMLKHFKTGDMVGGIVTGLNIAGQHLQKYFPHGDSPKNELNDDVAFMDGN